MSTPESTCPEWRIFMQLPNLHSISIQLALLHRSVFMLTLNIFFKNHSSKWKEKTSKGVNTFFFFFKAVVVALQTLTHSLITLCSPEVVFCGLPLQYLPFADTERTDVPTVVINSALGLDWVDEHVWAYGDNAVITSVKWTLIDCTASSFILKPSLDGNHCTLLISCF